MILCACAVGIVADILCMVLKKSVLRDALLLISTVACMAAVCLTIIGRANLMGYVWFSDLEKGNPVAVNALNIACGTMACGLIGAIANITKAFSRKG